MLHTYLSQEQGALNVILNFLAAGFGRLEADVRAFPRTHRSENIIEYYNACSMSLSKLQTSDFTGLSTVQVPSLRVP